MALMLASPEPGQQVVEPGPTVRRPGRTSAATATSIRRHVFDKLRALDLALGEFQAFLGDGEVIAEATEDRWRRRSSCFLSSGMSHCTW
jgi:hypothetical protein